MIGATKLVEKSLTKKNREEFQKISNFLWIYWNKSTLKWKLSICWTTRVPRSGSHWTQYLSTMFRFNKTLGNNSTEWAIIVLFTLLNKCFISKLSNFLLENKSCASYHAQNIAWNLIFIILLHKRNVCPLTPPPPWVAKQIRRNSVKVSVNGVNFA